MNYETVPRNLNGLILPTKKKKTFHDKAKSVRRKFAQTIDFCIVGI